MKLKRYIIRCMYLQDFRRTVALQRLQIPSKVLNIVPVPRSAANVCQMKSFLSIINVYKRFATGHANIATFLHRPL